MVETARYIRKPFEVDAVQVTEDNAHDVKDWCGGEIQSEGDNDYIKVDVVQTINDRQTKAFVGDWVLKSTTGFKVYTDKAFKKSFEKMALVSSNLD